MSHKRRICTICTRYECGGYGHGSIPDHEPDYITEDELSRIIKGRPESYSLKSNQFIHLSAPMYYEIKKADIFSWEDKDKDLYRIEAKVELKFSENTLKLFEVGKEND